MSHAVVVQVRVDPDSDIEHRHSILRGYVIPAGEGLPGFQHGVWLNDGAGTGTCVVTFDTEAHAKDSLLRLTPEGGPQVLYAATCEIEIALPGAAGTAR